MWIVKNMNKNHGSRRCWQYIYIGPSEREGKRSRERQSKRGDNVTMILYFLAHSIILVCALVSLRLAVKSYIFQVFFYFKWAWGGFYSLQPISSKTADNYCLELHSNQETPHYVCCDMGTPCLPLHRSALQNTILAPHCLSFCQYSAQVWIMWYYWTLLRLYVIKYSS